MSLSPSKVSFSQLGLRAQPPTIARLMTAARERPGLLSLAAGFTDTESLPAESVLALGQELLAGSGDRDVLQYGTNQGRGDLREQLVARFRAGESFSAEGPSAGDVIVTNGSQQALYLAMQVLTNPGDIVLVDRPSYFVFLEMLVGLGVQPVSIPVDAAGVVDQDALAAMLRRLDAEGLRGRVKALYFVSYYSNPSSRSLTRAEKEGIATVLSAGGWFLPVLEDAAYRELYFERPSTTPSVFGLRAWDAFPKLYLATLTKPFATGLKVGYALSSEQELLQKMLSVKGHHDFGTAHFNQALLSVALRQGHYDRQLKTVRSLYREKRDLLHQTLVGSGLQDRGWRWALPEGGLYLWLEGPGNLDTRMDQPFCQACLEAGVLYVPGDLCFGDEAPKHFVRLSFGVLRGDALIEAAQRFVRVAVALK